MGNYSGTIRCGHCYGSGHNRAGCEKLTEQYATEWEYCKNNVDPTAYRFTRVREQLAKRTGIDPLSGESKRKRRATYGGRVCSYCKDNGHNRRTCQIMKGDKARFTVLTVAHRADVLAQMRAHGCGPGALIAQDDYGTINAALITGIRWETINKKMPWPTSAIQARRVTDNHVISLAFPTEVTGGAGSNYHKTSMMAPAPTVEPPAGWSEASALDMSAVGLFDSGDGRDNYFWRNQDDDNG